MALFSESETWRMFAGLVVAVACEYGAILLMVVKEFKRGKK